MVAFGYPRIRQTSDVHPTFRRMTATTISSGATPVLETSCLAMLQVGQPRNDAMQATALGRRDSPFISTLETPSTVWARRPSVHATVTSSRCTSGSRLIIHTRPLCVSTLRSTTQWVDSGLTTNSKAQCLGYLSSGKRTSLTMVPTVSVRAR